MLSFPFSSSLSHADCANQVFSTKRVSMEVNRELSGPPALRIGCFFLYLLLNRVWVLHCNLRTELFLLGFIAQACNMRATDKSDEVSLLTVQTKIKWLERYFSYLWVQIEGEDFDSNKLLNLAGRTVKYTQKNWPIIAYAPRCNNQQLFTEVVDNYRAVTREISTVYTWTVRLYST